MRSWILWRVERTQKEMYAVLRCYVMDGYNKPTDIEIVCAPSHTFRFRFLKRAAMNLIPNFIFTLKKNRIYLTSFHFIHNNIQTVSFEPTTK